MVPSVTGSWPGHCELSYYNLGHLVQQVTVGLFCSFFFRLFLYTRNLFCSYIVFYVTQLFVFYCYLKQLFLSHSILKAFSVLK